jgi:hypothetical protein
MKHIVLLLVLLCSVICFGQKNEERIRVKNLKYPTYIYNEPSLLATPIDTIEKDQIYWLFSILPPNSLSQTFWHVHSNSTTGYIYPGTMVDYDYDLSKNKETFEYLQRVGLNYDLDRKYNTIGYVNLAELGQLNTNKEDSLKKAKEVANAKKNGLLINYTDWNYANEYSNFVTFDVSVTNYSKKTIKYIRFYIAAKDPVGGRISYLTRTVFPARGVGPITYMDYGQYTFEDVFYSKIVEEVYLVKIDVDYMDGTKRTYTNIKQIISVD